MFATYHLIMFYPFKNFDPVCLQNFSVNAEKQLDLQPLNLTLNLGVEAYVCVEHNFFLSFIFLQSSRKFAWVLF